MQAEVEKRLVGIKVNVNQPYVSTLQLCAVRNSKKERSWLTVDMDWMMIAGGDGNVFA